MTICLVKDGKAFEGETLSEVIPQITHFVLNYDDMTVFIEYKNIGKDTISYSKNEYSNEEFRNEALKRILVLLERDGWRVYRSRD